jgi:hypothetical protein
MICSACKNRYGGDGSFAIERQQIIGDKIKIEFSCWACSSYFAAEIPLMSLDNVYIKYNTQAGGKFDDGSYKGQSYPDPGIRVEEMDYKGEK